MYDIMYTVLDDKEDGGSAAWLRSVCMMTEGHGGEYLESLGRMLDGGVANPVWVIGVKGVKCVNGLLLLGGPRM
jgi:hypothetical protein